MTCIVGILEGNQVTLAADRLVVGGSMPLSHQAYPKVVRLQAGNTPMVVGFCGDLRWVNVVRSQLERITPPLEGDTVAWATALVDAIWVAVSEAKGCLDQDGDWRGALVLGTPGFICEIGRDGDVHVPADGYAFGGTEPASLVAAGAFDGLRKNGWPGARAAAAIAVRCACERTTHAGGDLDVVTTATPRVVAPAGAA